VPCLPVDPARSVLIVGNGPSSDALGWRKLHEALGASERATDRKLDLVLLNLRAIQGQTTPAWAVSVDPDILTEYATSLPLEAGVVTNQLARVSRSREDAIAARLGPRLMEGRADWPAHASGPLAVWSAVSIGYGRVYLYGLDGTAASPPGLPTTTVATGVRVDVWEAWIRAARLARQGAPDMGTLIRIWPDRRWRRTRDPLAPPVAETVYGSDLLDALQLAAPRRRKARTPRGPGRPSVPGHSAQEPSPPPVGGPDGQESAS